MRKMRCPHCAVINLEGFITFPHCAGCGALLPPLPPVEEKAWRRPLRTGLWTSVVGVVVIFAAMIATRASDPEAQSRARVVLSSRPTRTATLHQHVPLVLALDAPSGQTGQELFPAFKVRMPRDFFRDFRLISLEPQPDTVEKRGSALYFSYRELPSGTHLRLLLMPLRIGKFKLEMKLFSDNQPQNDCSVLLDVAPPQSRAPRTHAAQSAAPSAAS